MTANETQLQQDLESRLTRLAEELEVPGAAIGIYHAGQEFHAYCGVTNLDYPMPVDGDTLFQIGSTTKTFTGTAIMRLLEDGKVDLGAPVRDYVPELRLKDERVAERVTLLHLLNHTAGWTGDYFADTGSGDDALARYVELMAGLEQATPLGSAASYNNAAFSLAGRVIEKVTGETYERAVKELVFDPIGLEHSYVWMGDVMTRKYAAGHSRRGRELHVVRPWNIPRSSNPAGGIASTVGDQLRYARFHLGGGVVEGRSVLSGGLVERMRQPTARLEGGALGDSVGIAWLLKDVEGVRLVGHGGSTNGQQSEFQMAPEHDFAVTVLTNSDDGHQLGREMVKWALEACLGIVQKQSEPLPLGAGELAAYAGVFASEPATVTVVVEADRLVATVKLTDAGRETMRTFVGDEPPEQPPVPFKILPGDRFLVVEGSAKGTTGVFIREDGAISGVNLGGRLYRRA